MEGVNMMGNFLMLLCYCQGSQIKNVAVVQKTAQIAKQKKNTQFL